MDTENKAFVSHTGTLTLLIISTIVFVLLLAPAIMFTAVSTMALDAPGAFKDIRLMSYFCTLLSFPVLSVFSFLSWIFYGFKKFKAAIYVSLSPLISVIAVLLVLLISYFTLFLFRHLLAL
jgi:O-antigen/teichoic acid export membrane protein